MISVDSESDAETSVEVISESTATCEQKQIARLNSKVQKLEQQLKKEKCKENGGKQSDEHQSFGDPNQNQLESDLPSLPGLSDSFIERATDEWSKSPDVMGEFLQYLEKNE